MHDVISYRADHRSFLGGFREFIRVQQQELLDSSFFSLSFSLFIPLIFLKSYRNLSTKMVSLWGAKRGDPDRLQSQEHDDNDDDEQNQTRHQEPTEQTRLLPRGDSNNFLSPDDPAVCTALQKC